MLSSLFDFGEQNIALLLNIDSELCAVAGITLAESNLNFNREEHWFLSSEGSDIHQIKYSAERVTRRMLSREMKYRNVLSKFLWRAMAEQRLRS